MVELMRGLIERLFTSQRALLSSAQRAQAAALGMRVRQPKWAGVDEMLLFVDRMPKRRRTESRFSRPYFNRDGLRCAVR